LRQWPGLRDGAGIANAGEIPEFNHVDVAPTTARLLYLSLPDIDGKALTQILAR
jgi:hypothetical protein